MGMKVRMSVARYNDLVYMGLKYGWFQPMFGEGAMPEAEEECKEEVGGEPKPEPTPEAPVDGPIVEQLGYRGEVERVDTRLYRNRVVCDCGNVRWVKNADMFQVKKCKPCTLKERKQRRRKTGGNTK